MSETLNVILAQLNPQLRQTKANAATMSRVVSEYPEADLAVFPELFLSGYTTRGLEELAEDPHGPVFEGIAGTAREYSTAIVFGAPERFGEGYANSAFYIDCGGTLAGIYRKTHLFGDERRAFLPGDELVIIDVKGVKLGLMICFDMEFPEVARALTQAGADLLLTISANMEPFERDHSVFCTARALENRIPHAYVNQIGRGEEFDFVGGTLAVSADAELLVETSAVGEKVLKFELALPATSSVRPDYLAQLRPPLPVTENTASTLSDGAGFKK